jgi:hypothetical protein
MNWVMRILWNTAGAGRYTAPTSRSRRQKGREEYASAIPTLTAGFSPPVPAPSQRQNFYPPRLLPLLYREVQMKYSPKLWAAEASVVAIRKREYESYIVYGTIQRKESRRWRSRENK